MKELQIPEFKSYEEEAAFWDNLDTAEFMEDDGEWFRFETPNSNCDSPRNSGRTHAERSRPSRIG